VLELQLVGLEDNIALVLLGYRHHRHRMNKDLFSTV
jgi:hypothetical protein